MKITGTETEDLTILFKKDCACHSPATAGKIFTKIGEVNGMYFLTASYSVYPVCDLCGRPWLIDVEKRDAALTDAPPQVHP